MDRRLGSKTLLQLAFPREGNLHFLLEKLQWDIKVVNTKKSMKNLL